MYRSVRLHDSSSQMSLSFWSGLLIAIALFSGSASAEPKKEKLSSKRKPTATDEVGSGGAVADQIEGQIERLRSSQSAKEIYDRLQQLTLKSYVLFLGSKSEAERMRLDPSRKERLRNVYRVLSDLALLDSDFSEIESGQMCDSLRIRITGPWTTQTDSGPQTNELPEIDRLILNKVEEMCSKARD